LSYDYPFTEAEMQEAAVTWFANCGPAALAFAAQCSLETVRPIIPEFEKRGHTTPTMMKAALANLSLPFVVVKCPPDRDQLPGLLSKSISLVRVQFTGPWTAPGSNPRRAYRETHWIAAWLHQVYDIERSFHDEPSVFDCNGGMRSLASWQSEILPLLAKGQRRDGGWFPTHILRLTC
jgi:hypothetical protein